MINVIYSGDRFIFKGIYLSALSACRRTEEAIHFHLMSMSLNEEDEHGQAIKQEEINIFTKMIKSFNKDNEVSLYDVTEDFKDTISKSKNAESFYTPYCMVRLFLQRKITNIDEAIYLDADTMVVNSLCEFKKEVDISKYEYAAALDYLGRFWVKRDFINSGVLYINLKKCRETNLFEEAIKMLNTRKFFFSDQSVIYLLVKDRYTLPMRFNNQRKIKGDTVISHYPKHVWKFWDPVKPWQINRMRKEYKIKEFDEEYKYYLENFPFETYKLKKEELD